MVPRICAAEMISANRSGVTAKTASRKAARAANCDHWTNGSLGRPSIACAQKSAPRLPMKGAATIKPRIADVAPDAWPIDIAVEQQVALRHHVDVELVDILYPDVAAAVDGARDPAP